MLRFTLGTFQVKTVAKTNPPVSLPFGAQVKIQKN